MDPLTELLEKARAWYQSGAVGSFRAARGLPGQTPMCGKDEVWKVWEMPEAVQDAIAIIFAYCDSPKIEITSVRGRPDHVNGYKVV